MNTARTMLELAAEGNAVVIGCAALLGFLWFGLAVLFAALVNPDLLISDRP